MKKKLFAAMLAVMVALAFTACGGDNGGSGESKDTGENIDTFIVRNIGDPASLNPDGAADDNLYLIAQNMLRRLVALDVTKGSLVPEAAEEWGYNDDATELTFKLREDLKWSDGEALNAEDVKYTFDAIKENKAATFNPYMDNVEEVAAPDDYTVVFKLKKADVSFVSKLGWYGCFILPEHVWNNGQSWDDNEAAKTPVTCGPFKYDSRKPGESITLVADENYPDGSTVSKLVFSIIPDEATAVQALQNGEIDYMEMVPSSYYEELDGNSATTVFLNEYPSPVRMVYNFANKDLAKQEVRTAIAMAVDRDSISQKVFNSIMPAEYSIYPSSIEWASNTEDVAPSLDIEGAKALLEKAGYKADSDGMYIKGLEISVFEGNGYPDTAKLIKASLESIGIEADVLVSEYSAWENKVTINQDFDICLLGGFMGPDPSGMASRVVTGGESNVGGYSNKTIDDLMTEGNQTPGQEERAAIYKEAQTILAEELPYVPIVSYVEVNAYGSQFANLPGDGAGKWGWGDFSHVTK